MCRRGATLCDPSTSAHEPISSGDGRHRSLCGAGICGTQPQVDQLATSEGAAGHHPLPYRRPRRSSRSLQRLRTHRHLIQLVHYGEFSLMESYVLRTGHLPVVRTKQSLSTPHYKGAHGWRSGRTLVHIAKCGSQD